jgi:hypothetical protein
VVFSRLNPNRRHDKLLRLYLAVMRERAEAQLAGSSKSRAQRLAVRERALAGAVRSLRLHLGLPETFDPVLESARLGIDGKRPGPTPKQTGGSEESSEQGWRPRIRRVSLSMSTTSHDAAPRAVTVCELLDFIAAREVDPDSEIVVRRLSGGHSNAVGIGLTDDGRIHLEIQ